jgi:phage-related protein
MSEDLFYNRDTSISGIAIPETFFDLKENASYGSTSTFESKAFSYETTDSYFNTMPSSLNSLKATFKVTYNVKLDKAQEIISFIEDKKGNESFIFNPYPLIYRPFGAFCDNYVMSSVSKNRVDLTTEIVSDQCPNLLNWLNLTFTKYEVSSFNIGKTYKKYDIVYSAVNENKLNNFFYCTEGHIGDASNGPNQAASKWTQDFFFQPDIDFTNNVKMGVTRLEFKNSFPMNLKTKNNQIIFKFNYRYSNISDKQLTCMMHFLENKAGYRKFKHQIPIVFNRPKVFFCDKWSHTWKYFNCHDLDVYLTEDALGVLTTDS